MRAMRGEGQDRGQPTAAQDYALPPRTEHMWRLSRQVHPPAPSEATPRRQAHPPDAPESRAFCGSRSFRLGHYGRIAAPVMSEGDQTILRVRLRILYGFLVLCRYESRWAYPAFVG